LIIVGFLLEAESPRTPRGTDPRDRVDAAGIGEGPGPLSPPWLGASHAEGFGGTLVDERVDRF
jgi:hypothetical protein